MSRDPRPDAGDAHPPYGPTALRKLPSVSAQGTGPLPVGIGHQREMEIAENSRATRHAAEAAPIIDLSALKLAGRFMIECPRCGRPRSMLLVVVDQPRGRPKRRRDTRMTSKLVCPSCLAGHRAQPLAGKAPQTEAA